MTGGADLLQDLANAIVAPSPHAPAGCVIGLDLGGDRTVVASGFTASGSPFPMGRHTLFDLASVTKVVGTTSSLHRLASMGLLDVDTTVTRFVPGFGGDGNTTVRDLLLHRGGLWDWQPIYLAPGGGDDPFRVIDSLPLRYAPGTERHYSDLGFMTLGRVVEAVAAEPLEVAVRELVTSPLGLEAFQFGPVDQANTATSAFDDRVERTMVATGEPHPVLWGDDGFAWRTEHIRGTVNDGNCAHALGGVAGHAGLFSTVDAMLDVAAALSCADDRPSLWEHDVTEDFFAAGPDGEQALGWRRSTLMVCGVSETLLWHPGFTGTAVGFLPKRRISIAFASNRLLASAPHSTIVLWQRLLVVVTQILKNA